MFSVNIRAFRFLHTRRGNAITLQDCADGVITRVPRTLQKLHTCIKSRGAQSSAVNWGSCYWVKQRGCMCEQRIVTDLLRGIFVALLQTEAA